VMFRYEDLLEIAERTHDRRMEYRRKRDALKNRNKKMARNRKKGNVCPRCNGSGEIESNIGGGKFVREVCLSCAGKGRGRLLDDGFGMVVHSICPLCGRDSMQIVRPGRTQCAYCG